MASEPRGIAALFSVYNDDDDEDDHVVAEETRTPTSPSPSTSAAATPSAPAADSSVPFSFDINRSPASLLPRSPPLSADSVERKTLSSPLPPTASFPPSAQSSPNPIAPPSPLALRGPTVVPAGRSGGFSIVDYAHDAHDETAMSPEAEAGESDMHASEVQVTEGRPEDITLHMSTAKTQVEPSQSADVLGYNMETGNTEAEMESFQDKNPVALSADEKNDDPLSKFLPPPVAEKCSAELQQKINKFLAYKKSGKSFNADLRNRKDYRNPDFLQHAVRYQGIDQIGTCFSKDVFDPYGYDKSDYYDEIEADMRRSEKGQSERKAGHKIEFVGAIQPPTMAPILKASIQASAIAASVVPQVSVAGETASKENRPNKKTKWDKIDVDDRIPSVTGHNSVSTLIGVSAATLAAASASSGHAAFGQQKRRATEEKRTSEKSSRS